MAAYRICDGSRSGASQYTLIAITFSRISVQLSIHSVKIASQAEEGNLVPDSRQGHCYQLYDHCLSCQEGLDDLGRRR
jgi:hypothetical protein